MGNGSKILKKPIYLQMLHTAKVLGIVRDWSDQPVILGKFDLGCIICGEALFKGYRISAGFTNKNFERYNPDMCRICIDLQKGLLTPKEARRALSETEPNLDNEHVVEVENTIEILEEAENELTTDAS